MAGPAEYVPTGETNGPILPTGRILKVSVVVPTTVVLCTPGASRVKMIDPNTLGVESATTIAAIAICRMILHCSPDWQSIDNKGYYLFLRLSVTKITIKNKML